MSSNLFFIIIPILMVFYKCLITNTLSLMRSILGLPAQSLSRGGASAPLFNFPMQTKAKQGVAKPHLNATAWPHSKDASHQNPRADRLFGLRCTCTAFQFSKASQSATGVAHSKDASHQNPRADTSLPA